MQLGLDPLVQGVWSVDEVRSAFDQADLVLVSGMIGMKGEDYSSLESIRETGGVRSDEHWETNRAAAKAAAGVAHRLGLDLVTFHAGFLPHDAADPERDKLLGRLGEVADVFANAGVRLGLETGQETAATLTEALDELGRESVGVNFDPANMILYSMGDPVEALRALAPRVFQIHVKDATRTRVPGEWGQEVSVGTGDVDWGAFFGVYRQARLSCDLLIEREAGDARVADMRRAASLVRDELGEVLA